MACAIGQFRAAMARCIDNFVRTKRTCALMRACGSAQVERSELMPAVKRYKALLRHDAKLKDLFDRHDKSKDGVLHKNELLGLLKEVAADTRRCTKYQDYAKLNAL